MERYSLIHSVLPREFVLLQGQGCKWKQCTFCDYYTDVSQEPYLVNREVLDCVTGVYGVLDIINSGSAMELDEETIGEIQRVVKEKHIHTLWFETHYMYRHKLAKFAERFEGVEVKFRCGIESFDGAQRKLWNKGVPLDVTPADVARYFQGVCLLCCTEGEDFERIAADVDIAERYFEYYSVNLFCDNSSGLKRDEALVGRFMDELYPRLLRSQKAEVLLGNTDLGVG